MNKNTDDLFSDKDDEEIQSKPFPPPIEMKTDKPTEEIIKGNNGELYLYTKFTSRPLKEVKAQYYGRLNDY